ncbi:methyl-accepting chemotaxis protein [Aliiroseovarius crassostreae]|uniref:methyl-accepting chemotaxis protein n=1 Tax=Aliiroseovarius crassostreae TaxID=154981 RepID=UPI003C7E9B80
MLNLRRHGTNTAQATDALVLQQVLDDVQAIIWFDLEGNILDANQNFLDAVGYELAEIKGQHHRMFMRPVDVAKPDYKTFWTKLAKGERHQGKFHRIGKGNRDIYLEASYNPVCDPDGNPVKIVKFAIDITETRLAALEAHGKLDALSRSQAVVEFDTKGNILTANDNFLSALGYELSEIQGKHHRMFIDPSFAGSTDYEDFWTDLAKGGFRSGEFKRIAKGGREIWIQATYNPIFDEDGRPFKIVKFATDITAAKLDAVNATGQLDAISRSQAVIEFDIQGNILTANENFLRALGYSLDEVMGKHHRIFVDAEESQRPEYQEFWKELSQGNFSSGEYRRVRKDGAEIWIQATYNPILDPDGKPYKVVKFATDITAKKLAIEEVRHRILSLSEGKLSDRLPTDMDADFTAIAEAYNTTMERLEQLIHGIQDAADSIARDSDAIASNAYDLATRSESQAATVEQTSAAMEELSASVTGTATNAEAAAEATRLASEQAQKGATIVEDTMAAMRRIEESTRKISKVIEVIDGISFQTNLLALNAGVEAARAGESGRGFAVVASEVRALAQRAADSAQEINTLISKSSEEVGTGSKQVTISGEALTDIGTGVEKAVENIKGISNACQEQAVGINEVTQAVTQIDKDTQSTAALVGESAEAARTLAQQASDLRELISFFKVPSSSEMTSSGMDRDETSPATQQDAA